MNVMNLNERFLDMRDSLCFVAMTSWFWRLEWTYLAGFDITNACAAPKKWFIGLHFVHCTDKLYCFLSRLMNLMNFDELTYYLRLFFAMYIKRNELFKSGILSKYLSSFIRFIKNGGLA